MKNKQLIIGGFLILSLASCKKDNTDNCINNVTASSGKILISDADYKTAKTLFEHNKITYSNLQFYQFSIDKMSNSKTVRCYEYVNGLKVFTSTALFRFDASDVCTYDSGLIIGKIDLDTKSRMNEHDVAALYMTQVQNDNSSGSSVAKKPTGCLDVEFGYYDTNIGMSNKPINIIKAWKVTPEGEEYPQATIDDSTGKVIRYFNGVIVD